MQKPGSVSTRFKPGNQAAVGHGAPIKHGLDSALKFGVGMLPAQCAWISQKSTKLRRGLESLTLESHGELSLKHALLIQTACRCEVVALLSQRWLRLREADMTHDQRLSYLNNIANASERRDKAIEKLGLDTKGTGSVLDALYAAPVTQLPAEPMEGGDA